MNVVTSDIVVLQTSLTTAVGADDDADDVGTAALTLRVAALLVVAVLGLGANVLVAVVFYRRPTLRSPSNRFVLSLVLANVTASLLVSPVVLAHQLHRLWWLRQAAAGLTTLVVTAAVFSVLAIAVDRYHAVLSPLHYAMTVTRPRSRGMVAAAWGVAALLATPVLLGATDAACQASRLLGVVHALVLVALGFLFPLVALCWIYSRMYKAAHLNNERTRRHSVSTNPGEAVSRPGSLEMPLPPTPKAPLNPPPPRRRCSNASFSTLLFREEGKAVKTATMVITSFLVCFAPYFIATLIDAWDDGILPNALRFLATLAALASGCLTPFIYVFRNEAARAEAVKVTLFWRRDAAGQYGGNVSRDFEAYNNSSKASNGHAGHALAQRRQSLSYSDSVSVQSFQIPIRMAECRHCSLEAPPPPSADFVATYEVMDSPGEAPPRVDSTPTPTPKVRRESVTFRLAFMPQRRCQTCVRQNSDSSSGSGHPLLRDADAATPPTQKAVHQRRQRFLAARQGSSGEEGSVGSEPATPKHVEHNNNAHVHGKGGDAVILELDEQPRARMPRSPPVFLLQETSLERSDSDAERPERESLRQDSGYSDVTVDSGVGSDLPASSPGPASASALASCNSSITSLVGAGNCVVSLQARRHRPRLQRLAAVEDEEAATEVEEISPDAVKNKKNRSSFRTRFNRPAFRIPICEI